MRRVSVLLLALHVLSATHSAAIEDASASAPTTRLHPDATSNDLPQHSLPAGEIGSRNISSPYPSFSPSHERPNRGDRLNAHLRNSTAHHKGHGIHHRTDLAAGRSIPPAEAVGDRNISTQSPDHGTPKDDQSNVNHRNSTARHKGHYTHHRFELKNITGGPKKKMLVYVLCFDTTSCQAAHEQFDAFSWSIIIKLPKSVFFETYAFTHTFPERIESDAWHEYEYVGTISWKAPLKFEHAFRLGPLNMTDVVTSAPPGTDVIALLGQKNESQNMIDKAVKLHPRIKEIWTGLLQSFRKFSAHEISTEGMAPFYCNYWLAKPEHVVRFLAFMKKAQRQMEKLPSIQDALWSDAHYLKNTKLSQKVFGLDYYTYHPFVLERLTPFFFNVEKLTIYVYRRFGSVRDIKKKYLPSKKKKKSKKKSALVLNTSYAVFHSATVTENSRTGVNGTTHMS